MCFKFSFTFLIIILLFSCSSDNQSDDRTPDLNILETSDTDIVYQTDLLSEINNLNSGDCNISNSNTEFNGEMICFTIDNSTQYKIYSLGIKSSLYFVYFKGDNTFNAGSVKTANVSGFNLLFTGNTTGTFDLKKYSSYEGGDISYAGMGSGGGNGKINVFMFNNIGSSIKGSFEMNVCPYNINIHLITCNEKSWDISGTFNLIRDDDNNGNSNTPY